MRSIFKLFRIVILLSMILQYPLFANNYGFEDSTPSSIMWEISGKGMQTPSYLLGTIHVLCPDQFMVPEKLTALLEKCDQLLLEIDITADNYLQAFSQGVIMPDGIHLRDLLNQEDYKEMGKFLIDSIGLDINQIGMIKPLLLSGLILPHLLQCQAKSYETFLKEFAVERSISVAGLESAVEQLGFFDVIPYQAQAESILSMIRNYDEARGLYNLMIEKYHQMDLNHIYELLIAAAAGTANLLEVIFEERNKAWAIKIEKIISDNKTFIAVGVGHLPGEKGLIELLKLQGFTVKPVFIENMSFQ